MVVLLKVALVLLGGDPGIGKSTILLQICEKLGQSLKILYVSGEESKRQLKLRAQRLGVNNGNIYIMTETDVEIVAEQIKIEKPDLVMIDSNPNYEFNYTKFITGFCNTS